MKLKSIVDEDFVNYKKPSMFLIFPKCSFKCGRENCQNSNLMEQPDIDISVDDIIERYLNNPITKALVCGGLDPLDSFDDLFELIQKFRQKTKDDIVIYTGYEEDEIMDQINQIITYPNITVKFGRYIPNDKKYFNLLLGVELASRNQYVIQYKNNDNNEVIMAKNGHKTIDRNQYIYFNEYFIHSKGEK